jgi:nitrate/TMAO reductase-like tetraheme cytochrome c subunit
MFKTLIALMLVTCLPSMAAAQLQPSNACADCHYANPGSVSVQHLTEWDVSRHSRQRVTCDKCHGGNPNSFEKMQAHLRMLSPSSARSPVSRSNIPATCGVCHAGPFVAFQDSKHYQLLRAGDRNVPTCVTCHGNVAANVPSPKAVESRCNSCHGDRKVAPRLDLARQAALHIAGLNELRDLLDQADKAIARIKDPDRRGPLSYRAQQARVPLIEAEDAGHRFVYDQLEERLMLAHMRIEGLLDELANPALR